MDGEMMASPTTSPWRRAERRWLAMGIPKEMLVGGQHVCK